MRNLRLGSQTVAQTTSDYRSLRPQWARIVRRLVLSERYVSGGGVLSQRRLRQSPQALGVISWLMLFGASLEGLEDVALQYLPFPLEAIIALRTFCPWISRLEVAKYRHGNAYEVGKDVHRTEAGVD